jgi:hypothetical protein
VISFIAKVNPADINELSESFGGIFRVEEPTICPFEGFNSRGHVPSFSSYNVGFCCLVAG